MSKSKLNQAFLKFKIINCDHKGVKYTIGKTHCYLQDMLSTGYKKCCPQDIPTGYKKLYPVGISCGLILILWVTSCR